MLGVRDTSGPVVRELVQGVSFTVDRGSVLGIVGETGSGKTLTVHALVGHKPHSLEVRGEVFFEGASLLGADPGPRRRIVGRRIGIVVQDARTALNPFQRVGVSLAHIGQAHLGVGRPAAARRAVEALDAARLGNPRRVAGLFPHELSGGMAQRVLIAAAMLSEPDLIIADEATTGLDTTVQREVLDFLSDEVRRRHAAAIIVSHDQGVIAQYCTDVLVMYQGQVRERGPVRDVFADPAHPYTLRLMGRSAGFTKDIKLTGRVRPEGCGFAPLCPMVEPGCLTGPVPLQIRGPHESRCTISIGALRECVGYTSSGDGRARGEAINHAARKVVLTVTGIHKSYGRAPHLVTAARGVSLEIREGQTLALVGESGAGKSTVGRCVLRLEEPDLGSVEFCGLDISHWSRGRLRSIRGPLQAVFQDPASSVDPRMRVADVVGETLDVRGIRMGRAEREALISRALASVELEASVGQRRAHSLSGGELQRVAIARAMIGKPRLVVLDEPTASLDMSVRGAIVDLLTRFQRDSGVSYLLISHDLDTVAAIAHRIVVLYRGEVVESGPCGEVLTTPKHPYTVALKAATLSRDPEQVRSPVSLRGEPVDAGVDFAGCGFAGRCPCEVPKCVTAHPALVADGKRSVRCWLSVAGAADELRAGATQGLWTEGQRGDAT